MIGLADYLEKNIGRFRWGQRDCCCFAFDWVRDRTGLDPMEPWRGTYSDQKSAIRNYARAGGLEDVITKRMDALGFERTDDPDTGDVGVIVAPIGMRAGAPVMGPIAALRYGSRWLALELDGIIGGDFECKVAWRIP